MLEEEFPELVEPDIADGASAAVDLGLHHDLHWHAGTFELFNFLPQIVADLDSALKDSLVLADMGDLSANAVFCAACLRSKCSDQC